MVQIVSSSVVLAAVALTLAGCGGGGSSTTTAPSSSLTPEITTTTTLSTTTTTTTSTVDPDPRTPLYVIARLDNVAIKQESDPRSAAEVMYWFLKKKVKLNMGIITGGGVAEWPTACATSPTARNCDDPAVKAVYDAHANKFVLGTGGDGILEICNNGHDTYTWVQQWDTFNPKETFSDWLTADLDKSTGILTQSFPGASIRTLAVPQNLADKDTLTKAKAHGMDIVSTEATMACPSPQWTPGPPMYDYSIAPCEVGGLNATTPVCLPENDVWVTSEGIQTVANDIYSVPMGSSNSHIPMDLEGVSVADAIGMVGCGCTLIESGQLTCSLISSAVNNARKSHGLHWAGLLLHPRTDFSNSSGHNNYTQWLDEFYAQAATLKDYHVKFVNFQDIQNLRPPAMSEVVA